MLKIGEIYWLKFPGIAARVIEPPIGYATKNFPFLVESLFLRSRWWVNERGEGAPEDAPQLIISKRGRWTKLICAVIALFAVYFLLAAWLKYTYVDPTPKGSQTFLLGRKFEQFGTAVVAHRWLPLSSLDDLADTPEDNERSPVHIYEDGKPLIGPAHSSHGDISKIGMGRYSHWKGQGFVFSSSDNSDPNTNGRTYWAVVPENATD